MTKGTLKHLRNYFLTGLLVVLPVFLSIKIFLWLFEFAVSLTNWILVFLPRQLRAPEPLGELPPAWYNFVLNLLAFLVTLVFVVIVGMATRHVIGKRAVAVSEDLILRVPLLNKIYGTVKQITQTLWTSKQTVFSKVVVVPYPRPGVYAIGFLTSEAKGEAQARTQEDVINVFIPTTPNPTSGWLALVPRKEVIVLDMSVADGFKMVISGGAVVPPYPPGTALTDSKTSST